MRKRVVGMHAHQTAFDPRRGFQQRNNYVVGGVDYFDDGVMASHRKHMIFS